MIIIQTQNRTTRMLLMICKYSIPEAETWISFELFLIDD